MHRPDPATYVSYFQTYVDKVPSDQLLTEMQAAMEATLALLSPLSEEQAEYRYAEGKWSIKELIQHIIDAERVFNYRALTFARNDQTSLPGFDHDQWVKEAPLHDRTLASLLAELRAVRMATIAQFGAFSEEDGLKAGIASGNPMTVAALGYSIVGHELHHVNVIRERYL